MEWTFLLAEVEGEPGEEFLARFPEALRVWGRVWWVGTAQGPRSNPH